MSNINPNNRANQQGANNNQNARRREREDNNPPPVRNVRQRHQLPAEQALEHAKQALENEQRTLEHEQRTLEHEQLALENAQQALENAQQALRNAQYDDIIVLRKRISDRTKTIFRCEATVKVREKVLREKERLALAEQGNQPDERVVQQQLLLDQQHDRARERVDIQRMAQQYRERPAQAARPEQAEREAQQQP